MEKASGVAERVFWLLERESRPQTYLVNVELPSPREGAVVIATEDKDGIVVRVTVTGIQGSQQTCLVSIGYREGQI